MSKSSLDDNVLYTKCNSALINKSLVNVTLYANSVRYVSEFSRKRGSKEDSLHRDCRSTPQRLRNLYNELVVPVVLVSIRIETI